MDREILIVRGGGWNWRTKEGCDVDGDIKPFLKIGSENRS